MKINVYNFVNSATVKQLNTLKKIYSCYSKGTALNFDKNDKSLKLNVKNIQSFFLKFS